MGLAIAQVSSSRRPHSVVFDRVESKYDGNTGHYSEKRFRHFGFAIGGLRRQGSFGRPSLARYKLKDNEHADYKIVKDALDAAKKRKVNVLLVLLPDKVAELSSMVKQLGDHVVGMNIICNVVERGPKINNQFLETLVSSSISNPASQQPIKCWPQPREDTY